MAREAVSNSTPLIYLAKIGRIDLLKEIFEKVYIPEAVFEEVVVRGRELNKKEVFMLEELIDEGFIEVRTAKKNAKGIETLHRGETEAISLAKEEGVKPILMDDREGLEVARVFGLKPMRTTALLMRQYRQGSLSYEEFCSSLLALSAEGYFMRASVYSELIKRAKELKEGR